VETDGMIFAIHKCDFILKPLHFLAELLFNRSRNFLYFVCWSTGLTEMQKGQLM